MLLVIHGHQICGHVIVNQNVLALDISHLLGQAINSLTLDSILRWSGQHLLVLHFKVFA